jgi:hypothetical protein
MRVRPARLIGMSFEDLPPDWAQRPVTDPAITADLLDLVIGDRDRHEGAIGLLICGPGGRLLQPVVVSAPTDDVLEDDYRRVFDVMADALGDPPDGARPGMLVALARPDYRHAAREDDRWRDAAVASCAEHGIDLMGVWLVTPEVIRPLPLPGSDRRSA